MSDGRTVECQDCGYTWESTADSPRCSQAECGRSRNVEPVGEGETTDEPEESHEPDDEPKSDPSDDDSDDGFTPAFATEHVQKSAPDEPTPEPPETEESEESDDEPEPEEKTQTPEGDVPELDPEQLEPALEGTFAMVATKRGDHWELEEEEIEQLAEAWTPVLNHYAPVIMKEYTVIGAAIMVSATVVGPRVMEDKKRAQLQEKAAEDTDQSGTVRRARTDESDPEPEAETPNQAEAEANEPGGYASV